MLAADEEAVSSGAEGGINGLFTTNVLLFRYFVSL